jgi:GNAT superfamily N-acetyltransferase
MICTQWNPTLRNRQKGQVMEITILPSRALTPAQRQEIWDWLWQVFGAEAQAYTWAEPDWHVIGYEDGQRVCHIDITERTAMAGGQSVRLGGIGGVMTIPEYRGRGLASAALQRAAAFLHDPLVVEFGLLTCDPAMTPFYHKLGWQIVEEPLVYDQPSGKVNLDGAVMILPCRERAWPMGPIDLCGFPW